MESIKIEASAAEKWYFRGKGESNRFYAVHAADLTLNPGTLTVLTGRSGSGKTTLLHMLAGILSPSGGRITAGGEDLYAMDDQTLSRFRNRVMGMIPQGADLLPSLTVQENILLPYRIFSKEERPEVPIQANRLLEQLGIQDLCSVRAAELSGGERRRACIVRALAGSPPVVFADEPTSDLDDENTRIVLELLRESADHGAAVLIVTHDSEAMEYADVCRRMDGGVLS